MKIFGIVGWKNSGKTTLVVGLVKELSARGHRVSTIKHAHHAFDVDQPGKDSSLHREAGAKEVMISSAGRWALMHENRDAPEPDLDALLSHMSDVDIVLVEGFKKGSHEKLEIRLSEKGAPILAEQDEQVVAFACDGGEWLPDLPRFAHDDVTGIADFIEKRYGLGQW